MIFEVLTEDKYHSLPADWPADPILGVRLFYISHYEPYVTRKSKLTVRTVMKSITKTWPNGKSYKTLVECMSKGKYRVRCTACDWTGYRTGLMCECYSDWAGYCRPWGPGPGCPSGILWPCPACNGHGHDWRTL